MISIIVLILRILMAVFLYAFLGWTIFTLWNDLKFHSQILSRRSIPTLTINVEGDPQSLNLSFSQTEVIIGREDSCDVTLPDPVISGRHARLNYRNMHWWVEDLMSTNGTYLNDERVEMPAILINGDELRIGNNILVVDIQTAN